MPDMELAQAMRNVIEVERSASHFYSRLAGRARDAEARQLLEDLVTEEEGHARHMEQLARRLVEGELPQSGDQSCHFVETAPEWSDAEEITFREAVEIAIESEIHAALYYSAMADTVGDGPLFDFFNQLTTVEEEHARRLDQLLSPAAVRIGHG